MGKEQAPARNPLYGTLEIAQAIGIRRATMSQWIIRNKVPPADVQLSAGQIWYGETIEPWIDAYLQGQIVSDRRRREANIDEVNESL